MTISSSSLSFATLLAQLDDPQANVRKAALRQLARDYRASEYHDQLIPALRRASQDKQAAVRRAAFGALADVLYKDGIPYLLP